MSQGKKKFQDTNVGKFLLNKIPNVVGKLAGDTVVGNVIEAIIGGSEMSEADKAVALEKLRLERAEIDGVTRRWVADSNSQSWLARNVRPLVLAVLVGAYVAGWFMGLPTEDTASLLTWVLCGYFGARTADKIGVNFPNKK
ncbi:MAG: hypothetical protein CMI60_17370 [Parvibaculum sp.]|jgi:hypothetical protein|nr:hypothetical protein [Parvibaculum sp.]|tara:strand:+ start:333 stop:755 length:423 start_codon:yes stop_codon:yes gene_type:complete